MEVNSIRNPGRSLLFLIPVILLFAVIFSVISATSEAAPQNVILLDAVGAIGPATADYIIRGIDKGISKKVGLIILQLDTPGGLDKSMRDIIQKINSSPIPIATYIAPTGARAASAGTYILYASHIAAMAPGTNLGAASPVSLADFGSTEKKSKKNGVTETSVMEKKLKSDAAAYIRSLAQLRGRNTEWAQKTVLEGSSLSAQEALALHVIDLIANNVTDLLTQLNKRTIVIEGKSYHFHFTKVNFTKISPDWRMRFLAIITDPNVAYILLLIGIYGLFFEFMNPGFVLPGVVGLVSLIIALYAFQLLPINYAGLALILAGITFIIAEAFVPSFGALGVGGVIAFIIGSIMLLDTNVPGFQIMVPLIVAVALASVGLLLFIVHIALRAKRRPIVSGREELIGSTGSVILSKVGAESFPRIRIRGELWQIRSDQPLHERQKVKVVGIEDLILIVKPEE